MKAARTTPRSRPNFCRLPGPVGPLGMRSSTGDNQQTGRTPGSPRWGPATDQAREAIGWLRYAVEHPDDVTAAAVGRMVSKEYGAHERAHTEQHRWRSSTSGSLQPSPPVSPNAPPASTSAAASASGSAAGSQVSGPLSGLWPAWAAALSSPSAAGESKDGQHSAAAALPHSPPCGPGFLRQQQQKQQRQ